MLGHAVFPHEGTPPPPRFGSWNAWIGLVIGASRCMAVIPLGATSLILGRSLQTLAGFTFLDLAHHPKCGLEAFRMIYCSLFGAKC